MTMRLATVTIGWLLLLWLLTGCGPTPTAPTPVRPGPPTAPLVPSLDRRVPDDGRVVDLPTVCPPCLVGVQP